MNHWLKRREQKEAYTVSEICLPFRANTEALRAALDRAKKCLVLFAHDPHQPPLEETTKPGDLFRSFRVKGAK